MHANLCRSDSAKMQHLRAERPQSCSRQADALKRWNMWCRRQRPDVRLVLAKRDEVLVTGMEDDLTLAQKPTPDPAGLSSSSSLPIAAVTAAAAALTLGRPPLFPACRRGSS